MNSLDIKKIRNKLGISQQELAEMIGVHYRTIQNWERGGTIPKSKHTLLCDVLNEKKEAAGNVSDSQQLIDTQKKLIEMLEKRIEELERELDSITNERNNNINQTG